MAKEDKAAIKASEKELRKIIQKKIELAIADHKNGIDEKHFRKSLKKASKILSKEITGASVEKWKKQKKAGKKSKKKTKEYLM